MGQAVYACSNRNHVLFISLFIILLPSIITADVAECTLSGSTGRALAWHSEGRTFAAHWVMQVLWFAARIALCNTWSSGVLSCVGWGCDQSIGSTVSDAIVSSWLWSTATRSSPFGNFSTLKKVKSSMAKSLAVENLLPQNVASIINYSQ